MAGQTQVDTDKINVAEAKIAGALQAVRAAVDQLNAHTKEFCAAAGSDAKNGNLRRQSQADQENKDKQFSATNEVAEHDRDAARAAVAEYTAREADNTASLKVDLNRPLITGFE
ncbi:MAG: hypothetical protein ACRC20_07620 [Segniliparus sp.]|uniref:hypothetical protein n=1 Tax=Segniliparus sp. TaxID=2804064 RepID=UPI003F40C657